MERDKNRKIVGIDATKVALRWKLHCLTGGEIESAVLMQKRAEPLNLIDFH
jgi:hypothetical protein